MLDQNLAYDRLKGTVGITEAKAISRSRMVCMLLKLLFRLLPSKSSFFSSTFSLFLPLFFHSLRCTEGLRECSLR